MPQPQELVALGLSITNRAPISSSLKSITAPVRNGKRDRIDHHLLSLTFEHQIVFGRLIQPDIVLKSGTAAALDGHAQRLTLIACAYLGQPFKGTGRYFRGKLHLWAILAVSLTVWVQYMTHGNRRQGAVMQQIYAADPSDTRGRLVAEDESAFRSCFQRDRDRIIHASAFRRLKHKTQVFVEHEGDYFRTRLTHSIEVAQVARTIAGALGLNQELTEAVALAHDLGPTTALWSYRRGCARCVDGTLWRVRSQCSGTAHRHLAGNGIMLSLTGST